MPRTKTPAPMPEALANDFRKILAFASSALAAAPTLTEREALEVIGAIARAHVNPSPAAAAIARHLDRISGEIVAGACTCPAGDADRHHAFEESAAARGAARG